MREPTWSWFERIDRADSRAKFDQSINMSNVKRQCVQAQLTVTSPLPNKEMTFSGGLRQRDGIDRESILAHFLPKSKQTNEMG